MGGTNGHTTELATIFRALGHPTRIEALKALTEEPQSPADFASNKAQSLSTVAHHFRALHKAQLIEVEATEQRRGAIKSTYRLTRTGKRAVSGVENFA